MEIFALNSRRLAELLSLYKSNEIPKEKLNNDILLITTFDYFYFKKEKKKHQKIKEIQNKIMQSHFKKESAQENVERKLIKEYQTVKREDRDIAKERLEASIKLQRQNLLNSLQEQKDIHEIVEHSYNSYITPKNISLSLEFHLNNNREYKKYISEENAEISYKNIYLNKKQEKTIIDYIEIPFIIDKNNDILSPQEIKNQKKNNELNENLKNIANFENDDILFYDEKNNQNGRISKDINWLKDTEISDIEKNFQNLSQAKRINRLNTLTTDNDSLVFINFSSNDDLFDNIPQVSDHFAKFSCYLSEKCYKNYMKKMNYDYLDSMLLCFFDMEAEFGLYAMMNRETIALNFIKKIILSCGICNSKIYEHITKIILSKKGNFNLENFLDCFSPIFEASDKFRGMKYKFLLYLIKNHFSKTITFENYKVFCNLIKGKWIYDSEICENLSENMLGMFNEKYPKENMNELNFFYVNTIVELIVDKEYNKDYGKEEKNNN